MPIPFPLHSSPSTFFSTVYVYKYIFLYMYGIIFILHVYYAHMILKTIYSNGTYMHVYIHDIYKKIKFCQYASVMAQCWILIKFFF